MLPSLRLLAAAREDSATIALFAQLAAPGLQFERNMLLLQDVLIRGLELLFVLLHDLVEDEDDE